VTSPSALRLHDAHVARGARFGDRRGQPVVASYGDTSGEYLAARDGAALVDLPLRSLLEASGPARQ
jgi:glycine cleavage system aminomethyltransferase T